MIKLTPKQEKFAQGVASGKTQSDAYRAAYNTAKTKNNSIYINASKLAADARIALRIAELREPTVKKVHLTLESHLTDLMGLRNMAGKVDQFAVAVNAEIARGKAAGLYIEKSEMLLTNKELPASVDEFV